MTVTGVIKQFSGQLTKITTFVTGNGQKKNQEQKKLPTL